MKYNIYAKDIPVTDTMKEHIDKKLAKVFRAIDEDHFTSMDVRVMKERGLYKVEITGHLPGFVVRVEESGDDFYGVVEAIANILERRIKRYKERARMRHRASAKEILDAIPEVPDEEERGLQITRTKRFSIKPMKIEEALLQMEMLGHTFFVFRNVDTDEVNVLYLRKNGTVGLIEMSE